MASFVTNAYRAAAMQGLDLTSVTLKVALMSASYDGTIDTDTFANTYEVSGTGYTAGGVTVTTPTVTTDDTNDRALFDADDAAWDPITVTTQFAVLYVDDTGSTFDQLLIAVYDNGSTVSPSAGPLTVQWDSLGLIEHSTPA